MMETTILRSLVILALLWSVSASGQPPEDVAGWYRLPSGETVLLTYAATGGWLLVHFGEPPFATHVQRSEEGTLVTSEGGTHWRDPVRIAGPYQVKEVSFANGEVSLSGTLFLPASTGSRAGAVFIHGSGTSTRDNLWYLWIADRLARSGVAVLLPDKRGSGKSGGKWEAASLHDLAADTAAGVSALRAVGGVSPDGVGVIGVSQGGHIAPIVPTLVPDLAFIVNLSGSAVTLEEQLRLELTNTLRQGWPDFLVPLIRPLAVRIVKRRQPLWWEKNGKLDPIHHWRAIDVPALVFYGAEDERDNVPVTKSVERLRAADAEDGQTEIEIVVYPDSGHALYAPGTKRIREDLLSRLVQWIREHTRE